MLFFILLFVIIQGVFSLYHKDIPAFAKKSYTIVIDPGHGGIDKGAQHFAVESEIAEKTAEKLQFLLEQHSIFRVIRTRENGQGASIAQRAQISNENHADLLISLHSNFEETLKAKGFEAYIQTPRHAFHKESLEFGKLIAKEMEQKGASLRGKGGVRYLYYQENDTGGYDKVIREITDSTIYSQNTFGILEQTNAPAILVEQFFLTNQEETAYWASEQGIEAAATAYYKAICNFFDIPNIL